MDKIKEARNFLEAVGMPKAQQADICCYVLLAMSDIKPNMQWNEAKNDWIRIHDMIQFSNTYYGHPYLPADYTIVSASAPPSNRFCAVLFFCSYS